MSKRYDEYINKVTNKMNNNFLTEVIPMVPDVDQKLEREIRDRAIIELVKMSISKGMELTYGDICLMIDDDPSEKEYENIKNELILIKKFIFCKKSLDKLIKICYNANNSDEQLFQKL